MSAMLVLFVAFLSGALSVLTPCVLPLLPAILASSGDGGRRRPIGIVIGLVTSFTIALLAFSAVVDALGIPSNTLRWIAGGLLLGFGAVLLVPALERRFEALAGRLARFGPAGSRGGDGLLGGIVIGSGLGVVWAPCVGPIIGGVAVASQTSAAGGAEITRAIAFAAGMSIPLLAIVFGGRHLTTRLRARIDPRRIQIVAGTIFVATGVLVVAGFDTTVNRRLAEWTGVSSTLIAGLERDVLDADSSPFSSTAHAGGELADLGPAPELTGITKWLNTPNEQPLGAKDLDGKVVLYDFWTYSCINCLRTLPYLRSWHERYADDGLVIVGLHAPEFEFEEDEDNVRKAVAELDVTWPVALDNDFATWQAFQNQYWPAKYLVDRDGDVRYTHFGEGDYEATERAIRDLLGLDGDGDMELEEPEANRSQTPETYLGHERAANFVGLVEGEDEPAFAPGRPARYRAPQGDLEPTQWVLEGEWTVEGERAVAGRDASLSIRYGAADVHLVLGPTKDTTSGTVTVRDGAGDGQPSRVHVKEHTLYTLRSSDEFQDATLELEVPEGIAAYAFTFG